MLFLFDMGVCNVKLAPIPCCCDDDIDEADDTDDYEHPHLLHQRLAPDFVRLRHVG